MAERSQALQIVTFASYTTTNRDLLIPNPHHSAVIFNPSIGAGQAQIYIFNTIAELNAWESFLHYYNGSAEPANNEVPVWNATTKRFELIAGGAAHTLLDGDRHTDTADSGSLATGSIIREFSGSWQEFNRRLPSSGFITMLGFQSGDAVPSWQDLFDDSGTPAAVAAAAADGTEIFASRKDHVHPHPASQHAAGGAMPLFSPHTYVFPADADLDEDVAVGDQQGGFNHHSYDSAETVKRIITEFETAPTGADAKIQLEYADGEDWDTLAWGTEIDLITHAAGQKTVITTSGFTNASIPANRSVRMNVDQVGSTVAGKNLTVHVEVLRPLVTG